MGLDLRGLHPDDDLDALLDNSGQDSLDTIELLMSTEEIDNEWAGDDKPKEDLAQRLGTFRQMVHRITRNALRSH